MNRFFNSTAGLLRRMERSWRAVWRVDEIEQSPALQWAFGAILFFFFLTFQRWITSPILSSDYVASNGSICWPYFQDCSFLYFLQSLPHGYSQTAFYMALYAVMLCIVWAMWSKRWELAHALMSALLAWKIFVVFVLSYLIAGPYDYFHIAFAIVLLFLPHKEYFLKLSIVILYFLSAATKLDGTWVLGTYFTTLQTGLPLLPDALTPFFTNVVIFSQIIGAWFLLSKHTLLRYAALSFFVVFHLYSGILVYYHYPSVSLPLLIILFGMHYRHQRPPLSRSSIAGWAFIALLFVFQLPPYFIEGDRRMTLEGNRYGMFMFEANHQCVATITTYIYKELATATPQSGMALRCTGHTCLVSRNISEEGELLVQEDRYETGAAWDRCDPYEYFRRIQHRCQNDPEVAHVSLEFDHSINGGPFYRIVDQEDMCPLEYKPFSHNEWILLPEEAPAVGLPLKTNYRY